jgi:hypothetical protein
MNNGSGVSRGDRNRNARLTKLGAADPVSNAIVRIDLADRKQMVFVTDHDSKVLARRTFRCNAWDLGAALGWAAERSTRAGYAGVTVASANPPPRPRRGSLAPAPRRHHHRPGLGPGHRDPRHSPQADGARGGSRLTTPQRGSTSSRITPCPRNGVKAATVFLKVRSVRFW